MKTEFECFKDYWARDSKVCMFPFKPPGAACYDYPPDGTVITTFFHDGKFESMTRSTWINKTDMTHEHLFGKEIHDD